MPVNGVLRFFGASCFCAGLLVLPGQAVSQSTQEESPHGEKTIEVAGESSITETAVEPEVAPAETSSTSPEVYYPGSETKLTTEQIEESLGREQDEQGRWVDTSHEYIGTKADDLAIYLDRFFGSPIDDLESADSTIRFVTRYEWDDDDGSDMKFRLRGNVHLPRINDKLSLVFNSEEDDFRGPNGSQRESDENQVGLQLKAREGKRSRFDLTLSVSSDLNLKPGARYRYKSDLSDWGRFRYTARVDYSDKNRFRQRHSVDLDYLTGETSLLRWSNKLEHGQVSEGIEWGSAVSWRYGYSVDSAVAVIVGAAGKTEPDVPGFVLDDLAFEGQELDQSSLVTNYGIVLKFRNRLYKDWLYVEFEPGYTHRKRYHFEDRHSAFYGRVNLEIYFNRGRESKRKDKPDPSTQTTLTPEAV
ncbi:MAG: hypothetical protein V7709_11800 [Halioglobus sp.]